MLSPRSAEAEAYDSEFPGSGIFYYNVPPRNVEILHFQEFLLFVPPWNLNPYADADKEQLCCFGKILRNEIKERLSKIQKPQLIEI